MSLLKKAEVIFAVPSWADGKNDDGSWVDTEIKIHSTDGNTYVGFGHFGDASGITKNADRTMPIEMSGGINQLDNNTITKLSIKITYWFVGVGRGHSDHWTFRKELLLTFTDGTVVSSGYNDPPHEVDFEDNKQDVGPTEITRFYDHRTLVPPFQ
jgi:hypothetical protein